MHSCDYGLESISFSAKDSVTHRSEDINDAIANLAMNGTVPCKCPSVLHSCNYGLERILFWAKDSLTHRSEDINGSPKTLFQAERATFLNPAHFFLGL